MSTTIYADGTVDFSDRKLILMNCQLRMKNCEIIGKPVCADEQTSAIFEKMDRVQLCVEIVKLREKNDKLSDEIVKLCKKDDKLSEESSDLPTDQSSALVAVDSEETAKPCESREGSF